MANAFCDVLTTIDTIEKEQLSASKNVSSDAFSISDEVIIIYKWIAFSIVCQLVSILGIVANSINIACFIKQGFKDSINVSLLGLSVSDMGVVIPLAWASVLLNPTFDKADLPFDPMEVFYLMSAVPYLTFSRVSSWVTAIITLERCLCVIVPLKIKTIFTPKRTSLIITSVFFLTLSSVFPNYFVNRLDMKFSPRKNKTVLGLVSTTDRETVEKVSFTINNFVIPFTAFVFIIIFTITLAIKLHYATKWRKTSTNQSTVDKVSQRNQKVSKMILIVSILFIFCSFPSCIGMLALAFEPGLYFNDNYANIGVIIGGLIIPLQSVNSSGNILIYFHMSSKYRVTFRAIFCRRKGISCS